MVYQKLNDLKKGIWDDNVNKEECHITPEVYWEMMKENALFHPLNRSLPGPVIYFGCVLWIGDHPINSCEYCAQFDCGCGFNETKSI